MEPRLKKTLFIFHINLTSTSRSIITYNQFIYVIYTSCNIGIGAPAQGCENIVDICLRQSLHQFRSQILDHKLSILDCPSFSTLAYRSCIF